MKPFLDGWFYVPKNTIPDLEGLKRNLTIYSKYASNMDGSETKPAYAFNDEPESEFIGVPIRYAITKVRDAYPDKWQTKFDDCTSKGNLNFKTPKCPDLKHPDAHPDQQYIVPQTLDALKENRTSMLIAPTGSGKTVMALYMASYLGMKTLIVVNKERLQTQWMEEIVDKLGMSKEDIGIIRGNKCDVNKPFCIAMLQTLWKGKFTHKIRDEFGFVIYDEIDDLGAEKFCGALGQANACYQLAIGATVDRRDGRDQFYKLFFGRGDVKAKAPALPIEVHVLPYRNFKGNWGKNRNQKILCVSQDPIRNARIANLIMHYYKQDRNILIIGDYRKHLKLLFRLCVKLGLNPKEAGHFYGAGSLLQETANSDGVFLKESAYFDWLMAKAKIIFTTYGMTKKGISINRLDLGIDVTPRVEATQVIGRVRRPFAHKKLPLWFTIWDQDDAVLFNYGKSRIKEYRADKTVKLVMHNEKS